MEVLLREPYKSEMTTNRRHIHRRPEEGWTEFETTAFVIEKLCSWGYDVRCGPAIIEPSAAMGRSPRLVEEAQARARSQGIDPILLDKMQGWTGAVAVLDTGRPGPVTAFRVDLDCVCVQETSDPAHEANAGGYASERPGLMHACGHDGHTAVGLALAHWAADHKDDLVGKLKLIFQPAEEGTRGALPMVERGVVDDVDYLICSHIGTGSRIGEICICHHGFLATTKFDIRFHGTPAHAGSNPEKGRSALLAACSCATMLAGIPRSGEGDTRISIGRIEAGEGRNVIPVHAYLQIETRGSSEEVNNYMGAYVERIVKGCADAYEVESSIERVGHATTLSADDETTEELTRIAESIPFIRKISRRDDISGSEDCTLFVKRVREHGGKAGFFIFGCNENGHHKGDFCIQDEESLPEAFEMDARFLMLKNGRKAA